MVILVIVVILVIMQIKIPSNQKYPISDTMISGRWRKVVEVVLLGYVVMLVIVVILVILCVGNKKKGKGNISRSSGN